MKLTHIKAPATAPSAKLEDWGPVGEPVGQPVPALRGQGAHEGPDVGVWECSPGRFRRQIKSAELNYRWCQGRRVIWLAGVRWVEWNESVVEETLDDVI